MSQKESTAKIEKVARNKTARRAASDRVSIKDVLRASAHKAPLAHPNKKSASKITFGKAPKSSFPSSTVGYKMYNGVLIKEADLPKPVDASSLRKGLEKAKRDIKSMINEIADIMTAQYNISEIELSVSFNAEGKFMGFGVGGATSIKIKIAPNLVKGP
jgi:hypothetical protein